MRKILSNIIAFIKGSIIRMFYFSKVGKQLRLFGSAELRIYPKSNCTIGKKVKIDRFAFVVACSGATMFIDDDVGIGPNNYIVCKKRISIGSGTILGPNVMIYDHDHTFSSESGVSRSDYSTADIIIGKNCWIGANSVILKGTHIGDNCLIAAGSVVKGNIPKGTVLIQKRENSTFDR